MNVIWSAITVAGLAYALFTVGRSILHRQLNVDVVAVLALAGSLAIGEPLAGAIIAAMLATGVFLESRAGARAKRDLSRLVARTPTTARRLRGDVVETVPLEEVSAGDRVLVGPGEIVPVDGRLLAGATFDESALTGEPLPVERAAGDAVRSGVANAAGAAEIVATGNAESSTYAAIVRLVEQAQASSAPFVRFADRLAMVFVPLTLLAAGGAWLFGGSATRAVAVLVVATPCPLLLAAPIAIMSGLSRAARRGVIIKGGASLERLANGRTALLDKTGTVTAGRPQVSAIISAGGAMTNDVVLAYAGALEQVSPHVLADGIVVAARRRGLALALPTEVREMRGYGLEGRVDGHDIRVGKAGWILGSTSPQWARQAARRASIEDASTVYVAVDGRAAGAILLQDEIRPDAARMLRSLRESGVERIVLLTGDRADVADSVGRVIGVDEVRSECDPAQKLAAVTEESRRAATIMVGDGVNDAPALASAGVGVAIAARGASASSESADVVLAVDRLDALSDSIGIARRARRIGWRAAWVGMALSVVAMGFAAAGRLAPAYGALLQEFIDVLAMAMALVALLPARAGRQRLTESDRAVALAQREEHERVLSLVDQVRDVADGLTAEGDLRAVRDLLVHVDHELLPHEQADQDLLVPLLARQLGGLETVAPLSRAHAEIVEQVSRLHRLLDSVSSDAHPDAADVVELRRLLYGLYAVLRLHNAIEDDSESVLTRQG